MTEYKISGIWKENGEVSHYAFHEVVVAPVRKSHRYSKAEAVKLLETPGNFAITWQWNYSKSAWENGETVEVVNGRSGKYLRSKRDNNANDNLGHLIDYDWIPRE